MLIFKDVSERNSLFRLIDELWLSSVEAREANDRALHRICSLVRKRGVKTAIVENIASESAIIQKERDALSRYFNSTVTMAIFKVTFCTENIENEEGLKQINKNNSMIANATVVNFEENACWHSYVFNAIVGVPKIKHKNSERYILLPNNYIHNARSFECYIQCSDRDVYSYMIYGTYFCQQNYFTTVCAHATLCMVLNNQRILNTSIIEPEDLNIFLGIDHKSKKLSKIADDGGSHVTIQDIVDYLSKKGFSAESKDFFSVNGGYPKVDYSEFLYRHIESRHQCMLVFSTTKEDQMHIVPIMGHTLNTDLWKPEAEIHYSDNIIKQDDLPFEHRSASAWVDHFIINDDNFGMYYCLPVDLLRRRTALQDDPVFRAIKTVVITATGLKTLASVAEKNNLERMERNLIEMAMAKCGKSPMYEWGNSFSAIYKTSFEEAIENYWLQTLRRAIINRKTPFVVRTLLTTKEDYQHNLKQKDHEGTTFLENEQNVIMKYLPERFWLTEVTFPDLYTANGTKLIDIFYRSEIRAEDSGQRWIQTRMPGILVNNIEYIPLSVKSHYPLFSFKGANEVYKY